MRNKMVLYTLTGQDSLFHITEKYWIWEEVCGFTLRRAAEIISQVKKCTREWKVLEVTAIDYIYSIGIKISNITAGRIPPSWLIWGMLALLEDAPPHIHHRGVWRAGWRLAERSQKARSGHPHPSLRDLPTSPMNMQSGGRARFFSFLFSPTVPKQLH